ncbi:hypothetical protein ACJJTC_014648 [Scirpophaga incertulas]
MEMLEEALILCKFGSFHVRLLLTTLVTSCVAMMVSTTTSYVLPNAECDLDMDNLQKGLLTSMPFFGQVGAALFTGFITDAFGRKMFLVAGLFGVFGVLHSRSCSLCFTTPSVMVSEMIHKNVRDRVLLMVAAFVSISLILIALISWAILPQDWNFTIIEGYFYLHSWNIYLYVCSAFSLAAGTSYYFLPESPKFLLSHGQENESVGSAEEHLPLEYRNALFEVKNLFRKPLFGRLCLFSVMTFACLLAYSALRMWFPQLSTIVENYRVKHNQTDWFCEMITEYTEESKPIVDYTKDYTNITKEFEYNIAELMLNATSTSRISGSETYTNGMILGCMSLIGIGISTYTVNFFGHKLLIVILLIISATCSLALYWTNYLIVIALLISATCGLMQTALSLQQNLLVRVFPTTLRTLSVSVILMAGRTGSLLGSILFPVMLSNGCMVPFIALSVITLCVACLSYFLPAPNNSKSGGGDK